MPSRNNLLSLVWPTLKERSFETRVLLFMALATYLSCGLYLGLFTEGIDFSLVYGAAYRLVHGQGAMMYDAFFQFHLGGNPLFFMYPPLVAMLYAPFGFFSRNSAFIMFQILSHCFLWGFLWICMQAWFKDRRQFQTVFFLTLLFFPLYYCLWLGQSETLLLLCLGLTLYKFKEGQWWISSLFLTVAIGLKMFLALFLVYFLMMGQWKYVLHCLAWIALSIGLSLWALPLPLLQVYIAKLGSPIGIEAFVDNQSLTGFLYRSLTSNAYTESIANLPRVASLLRCILTVGILGFFCRTIWKCSKRVPVEQTFSWTLVTLLLISPFTDTHHLVLLLFPFIFLLTTRDPAMPLIAFYSFFACFVPLWSYKFLSIPRGLAISQNASQLILSLPFFVLAAFWAYGAHGLFKMAKQTPPA